MRKPDIGSISKKNVVDDLYENEEIAKNILSFDTSFFDKKENLKLKSNTQKEYLSKGIKSRNFKDKSFYHEGSYICNNPSDYIMKSYFHSNKIERLIDFDNALNKMEKLSHSQHKESCTSLNSSFEHRHKSRYSSIQSRYQSFRRPIILNQKKNEEFSFSPSINKKRYRSRSVNQFIESQNQFLSKKNSKIAHQFQKQLSFKEKIRPNSIVTKQMNSSSTLSFGIGSEKKSCILACPEKHLTITKKVKISDFQKYIKDNLSAKATCNHFPSKSYVIQSNESNQNVLYKKMIKDIDKILVKNRIFSNKLTFNDMETVFEDLGFKSKVDNKEQSNALKVIWNSIKIQGENTIETKELKIALMALSNIKIPKNSVLFPNYIDFNTSKNESTTLDNSQFLKYKKSSYNILKLNHIRRDKKNEYLPVAKSLKIVNTSEEGLQNEVFSRLTRKIDLNNSMQKVIETKNSPLLNNIDDKGKKAFAMQKLNQGFLNLVSQPKFKILDKKPYMLLNSECTFAPNISELMKNNLK